MLGYHQHLIGLRLGYNVLAPTSLLAQYILGFSRWHQFPLHSKAQYKRT